MLSSTSGDAIKNYFTFVYHIKNDNSLLNFSGMNYPTGEHIVYTDCQPFFTFILKLFPFLHQYLVGTLHGMLLFSIVVTPLIINAIMLRLNCDRTSAFFISLAIAILAPQIRRIDGHFALAYQFMIPLSILLLIKFFQTNHKTKIIAWMVLYNSLLFLIHPYMGFGCSVLSLLAMTIFVVLQPKQNKLHLSALYAFCSGILPILFFRLFMVLSDQHQNRTVEPDGIAVLVANIASVFAPNFGPFETLLKHLISDAPQDFEGLAYVGFFSICMVVCTVLLFVLKMKRLSVQPELLSIFLSAIFLLLFSFGIHNDLFQLFHIHTNLFNQFRALGRFAWFFYYTLPIFLTAFLYQNFKNIFPGSAVKKWSVSLALLFFVFNLTEASYVLKTYGQTLFKDRNIFNKKLLTNEEKMNIARLDNKKVQAIVTLPAFFLGSEVYSRIGNDRSMVPAILYAYHSNTPIWGTFLSRTSISETADNIELLNSYKKNRNILRLLNDKPLLVIKTNETLLPDEERLYKKVKVFSKNDSLNFGFIDKADLSDTAIQENMTTIFENKFRNYDSAGVNFIFTESRPPFTEAKISDYQLAFKLDSGKIQSGRYIVSLHFHYREKTFRDVYSHLVVVNKLPEGDVWEKTLAIRIFSGFYEGFAVFEYALELNRQNKYEFLMYGFGDKRYHISDFMLRPEAKDVRVIYKNKITSVNNFPL